MPSQEVFPLRYVDATLVPTTESVSSPGTWMLQPRTPGCGVQTGFLPGYVDAMTAQATTLGYV